MRNQYFKSQIALTTPFDNSTNGFTADEVQSAIEEARQIALDLPVYTIPLIMNGTMSNGDWITYSNLTPDNSIRIPIKSELKAFTYDNTRTSVDFDMEFYLNGRTTTKYATREVRNVDYGGIFTGLSDPFDPGDTLDIKYVDQGTNASDLTVILFFRVVN